MAKIFISYRWVDSQDVTHRIHEHLTQHFGAENVFMDIDAMPLGADLRKHVDGAVATCDLLLAMIGKQWLDVQHKDGPNKGQRRLDDPTDVVRMEVETALERDIPVIPVLVGGVRMPGAGHLPEVLRPLAFRVATEIASGKDFKNQLQRLIEGIHKLASPPPPKKPPVEEVHLFDPSEFEKEALRKRQAQRQFHENALFQLVQESLERTQGKPDKQADDAVKSFCRQHQLDTARAKAIIANARNEWSKSKAGAVWTNSVGMKFSWVPAGRFWIGGGNGKPGDKEVEIQHAFQMGIYPVTQEQWQSLMGNNPSYFKADGLLPVEMISWYDTQEFIKKMNVREQDSGWAYRLPTVEEWEYSCRGAPTTKDECSFDYYFDKPTNNLFSDQANFACGHPAARRIAKGKSLGRTTKVGSYPPNRLGIFDMHGNVWEWCDGVSSQALLGGSWMVSDGNCTATYSCFNALPTAHGHDVGFRLARVPS